MNLKRIVPGPWTLIYLLSFLGVIFMVLFFWWFFKNPIPVNNPYKVYP
ncbi:hypothetical protein CLV58_12525 [Spirosoma oryzae]|uniref:Uncharacterized protein n=1 Tax=Spirosoma oryzae TaxID=1469603 RepID=A0A2T0S8X6_9BACT|nr:hypothetical protein [Spirosoma oryzae]PRY29763.1 hypothetical protein CLV58_12525 [Spirosoma oryzae]